MFEKPYAAMLTHTQGLTLCGNDVIDALRRTADGMQYWKDERAHGERGGVYEFVIKPSESSLRRASVVVDTNPIIEYVGLQFNTRFFRPEDMNLFAWHLRAVVQEMGERGNLRPMSFASIKQQ